MSNAPFNRSVILSPGMEELNARRLFVFAESRSGSTWLIDTLKSHPEISMLDEILNPDFIENFKARHNPGNNANLKGSFQFIENYLAPLTGKFAGCKILFPQAVRFMDFYEFIVNYRKSYFILLFRKNSAKAEISDMIANKHARWHLTELRDKQMVSVDPRFLYERLLWRKYASEFCSNMLKAHCENLLIFEYENLFKDIPASLAQISSFLNLPPHEYQYSPEVKSNPFQVSDLIVNYQECLDFFSDKPGYFEMITENNPGSIHEEPARFSYPLMIERSYAPAESLETYEKEEFPALPESALKLIAFYLPQFHPFDENDRFWGKGFTEWHNVTRALPLFPGHYQPRLPGELGFYDLRVKEVMQRQVELARQYGISGFCFHHYFLNGKPLMRLPFNQFLNNQDLDFPFCIHWANEPWTSRWDGNRNRGDILLDQVHDEQENMAFIEDVLPAFKDKRYIQIDGKPLLLIYRPGLFPEFAKTADQWREHCMKAGFKGLFLVMVQTLFDPVIDPTAYGCDAAMEFPPHGFRKVSVKHEVNLFDPGFKGDIFSFREYMNESLNREKPGYPMFRGLFPQWDNTSRRIQANVFHESTPALYQEWLSGLCRYTRENLPEDRQLVFINAWNEWAEGAYLEPDRKFGYAYLNATARALQTLA